MNEAEANEYTESLAQIFAGSWRQIAWAKQQGIPATLGLSTEQWVKERLGGYVRMAIPDRREAVAELTDEGLSNVAIGEVLGIDEGTVRSDRRSENSAASASEASNGGSSAASSSENSAPSGDVETEAEKAERIARVNRFATIEIAYQVNNVASLLKSEEQVNRLALIIRHHADEYEEYARHKIDHLIKSLAIVAEGTAALIEALREGPRATEPERCPRCDGEGCRWCGGDLSTEHYQEVTEHD